MIVIADHSASVVLATVPLIVIGPDRGMTAGSTAVIWIRSGSASVAALVAEVAEVAEVVVEVTLDVDAVEPTASDAGAPRRVIARPVTTTVTAASRAQTRAHRVIEGRSGAPTPPTPHGFTP